MQTKTEMIVKKIQKEVETLYIFTFNFNESEAKERPV